MQHACDKWLEHSGPARTSITATTAEMTQYSPSNQQANGKKTLHGT